MSQITVKEKEHWRERIQAKIDKAIDDLINNNDPGYRVRIENEAKAEALKLLGIAEMYERRSRLFENKTQVETEIGQVNSELDHAVRTNPLCNALKNRSIYSIVDDSLAHYTRRIEAKLMESDPIGARILALQNEKEALLDTIWLATTGSQIRNLWTDAMTLLEQTPSTLQKKTLAGDAVPNSEAE